MLFFNMQQFFENAFCVIAGILLFIGLIFWFCRPTKEQRERREKREQAEREKRQIELLEEISRQQQYHNHFNDEEN